jgi:hypothetical protein
MGESLQALERRRSEIAQEISGLGDLRPGSVTAIHKKCGKSGCCCTREDHPGHGPHWRLTFKTGGRTQSKSLTGAAIAKAEGEIAEFRRYQQLTREFVEINTRICQLRPAESSGPQEKKRRKPSSRR